MGIKVRPQFSAAQLTDTKWSTGNDKLLFLEKLARFVESGYPWPKFTKSLYTDLSGHLFSHIAHVDREGFYAEWFTTEEDQRRWIQNALCNSNHGSPDYTWSDAEEVFQEWLTDYVRDRTPYTVVLY